MEALLLFIFSVVSALLVAGAQSALTSGFYASSCPNLEQVVSAQLQQEFQTDSRLPASLLRMHFHDCFVQGCDASVLLDDTSTFTGEKNAGPNANSLRGFDAVDRVKAAVEASCKGVVSCADILALAARDSVSMSGGPTWDVLLGRRDSTTASLGGANSRLPAPSFNVQQLISAFQTVGLTAWDMFVLSGAHTLGQAKCSSFSFRLFNFSGTGSPDPSLRPSFLSSLQALCPQSSSASTLQPLDVQSPTKFDNQYYLNLVFGRGLLGSDQTLFDTTGVSRDFVKAYSSDQDKFFTNFANAMINMGNLSPLESPNGIIRSNCRIPS